MPVETRDRRGRKERTTDNKDEGKGSPQGSPLSPLLANIYMRRFIRGWKTGGHEKRLRAHIVNYADDFVICCCAGAEEAMATMRSMMSKLKLTVNETKTRLCVLPEGTFDFLGYTFGRCYNHRTGEAYLAASPAKKKVAKLRRDRRADQRKDDPIRRGEDGRPAEHEIARLGELLRLGRGEPSVSCG